MSSSNKLHPIYVALDSHQYNRAVKLAAALPASNLLGQALYAHALLKSGNIVKALTIIQQVLWFDSVELEYEVQRLALGEAANGGTRAGNDAVSSSANKQPKASKHKQKQPTVKKETTDALQQKDLIKHLNEPLVLPNGWEQVSPKPGRQVITDETTLDTLAVTLQAVRLQTSTFQLYHASTPATLVTLLKTYSTGLAILSYSNQYSPDVISSTLSTMQVVALQLARISGADHDIIKLWAAQTALWQLQYCESINEKDDKIQQRLSMLPRLAESFALKYKNSSAEASLLYIQTLQQQDKHEEIVTELKDMNSATLTTHQQGELLVTAYTQLQQWAAAVNVYQSLLKQHSGQWMYWKGLLESAYRQTDGDMEFVSRVIQDMLETTRDESLKYPCRSRSLIVCELAAVRIRGIVSVAETKEQSINHASKQDLEALRVAIVEDANAFASRASCAHLDVAPYIELYVKASDKGDYESMLKWACQLRLDNQSVADRSMLRTYIFAIQVTFQMLRLLNDTALNEEWLPEWKELVTQWRASQPLGTAKEGESVQKENQPGDDLILLAVQSILFGNDTDEAHLLTAATLLEQALQSSPYNTYLKILAIDVYARLSAVVRSWELFKDLSIKHVQLDSCSYLISSVLVDGGLYNESIQLSNEVLKFHGTTARDTGEYAFQAMDHGTLSKTSEFLEFQRNRMNSSLTLLEAKGRIMDCAPVLFLQTKTQAIGMNFGIVAGEYDLERATEVVREAHNSFGAPSVMTITASDPDSFSDNRDLSILSYQILYKPAIASKEQLVQDSIRRGLLHGLLVRLSLCIDATKGPKKGKVTKASHLLQKRCSSLLDSVNDAVRFQETANFDAAYEESFQAMLVLCRVIAYVSAGMPVLETQDDSLANREQFATQHLDSIVISNTTDWTVVGVCRFLPDILVPLTVMVRMTANLFSLYGWGKRKYRTKQSAGALAELASYLKQMVKGMRTEMESLPDNDSAASNKVGELWNLSAEVEHLDKDTVQSVCERVVKSRLLTRQRVMPFLDEILAELSSFEIEEQS